MGAIVVFMRRLVLKSRAGGLTRRDFGWIALYGIPGAVGTACYALAVAGGPVAIVATVLSTMMVATSVLAWLIHGERLHAAQWLLVGFICCALMGMRLSGG